MVLFFLDPVSFPFLLLLPTFLPAPVCPLILFPHLQQGGNAFCSRNIIHWSPPRSFPGSHGSTFPFSVLFRFLFSLFGLLISWWMDGFRLTAAKFWWDKGWLGWWYAGVFRSRSPILPRAQLPRSGLISQKRSFCRVRRSMCGLLFLSFFCSPLFATTGTGRGIIMRKWIIHSSQLGYRPQTCLARCNGSEIHHDHETRRVTVMIDVEIPLFGGGGLSGCERSHRRELEGILQRCQMPDPRSPIPWCNTWSAPQQIRADALQSTSTETWDLCRMSTRIPFAPLLSVPESLLDRGSRSPTA